MLFAWISLFLLVIVAVFVYPEIMLLFLAGLHAWIIDVWHWARRQRVRLHARSEYRQLIREAPYIAQENKVSSKEVRRYLKDHKEELLESIAQEYAETLSGPPEPLRVPL